MSAAAGRRKGSEFVPHAEKIGFLHMIKVRSLRKFEFGIASLSGRKSAKGAYLPADTVSFRDEEGVSAALDFERLILTRII